MNNNKLKKEDCCDAVFRLLNLNWKSIIFAIIFITTAGFVLLSAWLWGSFLQTNPTYFDMLVNFSHPERNTLWYKYIENIFDVKALYVNICIAIASYWWIVLFKLCNLNKLIYFFKEKQDFISPILGYFYAVAFITISHSIYLGDKCKIVEYLFIISFLVTVFNLLIFLILLSLTDRAIKMSVLKRVGGIFIFLIIFSLMIGFTLKSGFEI